MSLYNKMFLYIFVCFLFSLDVSQSYDVYNYYVLALQKWCSSDYMIHGLWPQINSTAYPEYCKPVFYSEPTGSLLTDMNTYWYKCDDTLWEHEWEKHGSCMQEQDNIDENTFFNIALSLFLNNSKLIENCTEDDCIMGCFDLDYNLISCDE